MSSVASPSPANLNHHHHTQQTTQTPVSGTSAANEPASDQSNPPLSDAQAAPAPPQASPTPKTLTLALPSVQDDDEDHYAVVSFPATYKVRLLSFVFFFIRPSIHFISFVL